MVRFPIVIAEGLFTLCLIVVVQYPLSLGISEHRSHRGTETAKFIARRQNSIFFKLSRPGSGQRFQSVCRPISYTFIGDLLECSVQNSTL